MASKTYVGLAQQGTAETLGIAARLVAGNQQNGAAPGVEGKTSLAAGRAEPHLLHVRVPRPVHRIHMRPTQLRIELAQQE